MKQEITTKKILCPVDVNQLVEDMEHNSNDRHQLTHDEVLNRIKGYFNSITRTVHDQEAGEVTTEWISPPTKSGLARSLGIDRTVIPDILSGTNSKGEPYQTSHGNQRIAYSDMGLVRQAVALIEEYYEAQLSSGRVPAGSIFWLLNSRRRHWANEDEVETEELPKRRVLSANELPTLAQLGLSETDSE